MEKKFKVLKSKEFWITVVIMIPVVVILYGIMYLFNSPAIAHAAGNATHVKIVSGKTTRSQIFRQLGTPDNDVIESRSMVYNVAGNVSLIINFAKPYKSAKSLNDKVSGLAWCGGTGTGSSCVRFKAFKGETAENCSGIVKNCLKN